MKFYNTLNPYVNIWVLIVSSALLGLILSNSEVYHFALFLLGWKAGHFIVDILVYLGDEYDKRHPHIKW